MSFTWVDLLFALFCWAAKFGAGLAAIVAIIVAILRNKQWHYVGIAFVCGFILALLTMLVMIAIR